MNSRLRIGLAVMALALLSSLPAWGADGASAYKKKCSHCHGANGEGKKGPALKGTSMSSDDIVALLTKGDPAKKSPHSKSMSGMNAATAQAIADYIKSLK